MSLAAHHLEENGIPTVVLGSARDIVEQAGVARFLFTDFPLGNSCGRPYDAPMQRAVVGTALDLLASARAPRTTVESPLAWDDEGTWRRTFMELPTEM